MGQVLHGCATTTHVIRASIQRSKAPLKELAAKYGINQKTVAKWRKRSFLHDAAMGPKVPCSTVLTADEEAMVVAFRKHTLLPLDDCLYALQATIRALLAQPCIAVSSATASAGCPKSPAISPPNSPSNAIPSASSTSTLLVRTEEGKLHLFVAVDRTSKYAFAQLHKVANVKTAAAFLAALIEAVPYKIHTIPTDNGIQFCDAPQHRSGPTARYRLHMFDRICRVHGIEPRLTKPNHPWTNGQVERMNRTLKKATVRRYHYDTHRQLEDHLAVFLDAYNFAKRLKTLRGLTPYEAICKAWVEKPKHFRLDPAHLTSGLNT
jgi:hypothetical protein